jgi:hypothetical protein
MEISDALATYDNSNGPAGAGLDVDSSPLEVDALQLPALAGSGPDAADFMR